MTLRCYTLYVEIVPFHLIVIQLDCKKNRESCRQNSLPTCNSVPYQPLPFTKSMAWVDQFSNIWFVVSPTYLRIYFFVYALCVWSTFAQCLPYFIIDCFASFLTNSSVMHAQMFLWAHLRVHLFATACSLLADISNIRWHMTLMSVVTFATPKWPAKKWRY